MWEEFDNLTLKCHTLASIRALMKNALKDYTDIVLLKRMIRVLRKADV